MKTKETSTLVLGLQTDQQRKQIVVSSRDVARVFEKEHKRVLQDIRELNCSEDFGRHNFVLTSYTDQWKREKPEYLITKNGFTFLAMGYNTDKAAIFKEAYIAEFDRMQAHLDRFGGFSIPDNLPDALALAAEQAREVQRLSAENAVLQPKADFFDVAMSSEDVVDMNAAAKILNYNNMGAINLFRFLKEHGILMQNNRPYQRHVDKGYFKVVEKTWTTPQGNTSIKYQPFVSQRGLDAIRRLLNKHGKVPRGFTSTLRKAA